MSQPSHYSAAELMVLLGFHDLELFELVEAGALRLEPDGFTAESVARLMASGRG